jgi:hypothetical protein
MKMCNKMDVNVYLLFITEGSRFMWSLPDGSLIVEEFGGFLLISL